MLPVTKVYHGIHRKEFLQLMRRLVIHFAEWPHYYTSDGNKVAEACRHLSEGLAVKWALVRLTPEDRRTWSEFCVWLNSNIRNFVNPDIAERRYKAARQCRGGDCKQVCEDPRIAGSRPAASCDRLRTVRATLDRCLTGGSERISVRVSNILSTRRYTADCRGEDLDTRATAAKETSKRSKGRCGHCVRQTPQAQFWLCLGLGM
ncbi:hypothetical protein BDW74DRAFT_152738 [Aspergillus multicolor]|uniref:uncharacterized protein n=1 Tax=Aspergillus multicolor TaxID=41759 RepID=UPI003CCD2BCE